MRPTETLPPNLLFGPRSLSPIKRHVESRCRYGCRSAHPRSYEHNVASYEIPQTWSKGNGLVADLQNPPILVAGPAGLTSGDGDGVMTIARQRVILFLRSCDIAAASQSSSKGPGPAYLLCISVESILPYHVACLVAASMPHVGFSAY